MQSQIAELSSQGRGADGQSQNSECASQTVQRFPMTVFAKGRQRLERRNKERRGGGI